MKNSASFQDLVNQLVTVFCDDIKTKEYQSNTGSQRIGLCGWSGVMAPANRIAYVEDFGETVLSNAEKEAHAIIKKRNEDFEKTHYASYEQSAKNNAENSDFIPVAGSFVLAVCSGLKQNRTVKNEISDLISEEENWAKKGKSEVKKPVVCRIDKVFHVNEEDLISEDFADNLVSQSISAGEEFPGGADSEDFQCKSDYWNISDEEKKTMFLLGAAVVTPSGKWYIIDSEGYDYARYIYLPVNWKSMFAEEYHAVLEEKEVQKKKAIEKAAQEKAARKADYMKRYEKWAPLMQEIAPFEATVNELKKSLGYNHVDVTKAERKLHNVCRSNILTMCRVAFPGVKFSLRHCSGWGDDWVINWIDGPTEKEFAAATDLRLFASGSYQNDAYADYWDFVEDENMSFAQDFMSFGSRNGIDFRRNQSLESRKEIKEKILSVCPIFTNEEEGVDSTDLYEYYSLLANVFGQDIVDKVHDQIAHYYNSIYICDLQNWLFKHISYYAAPEKSPEIAGKQSKTISSAILELVDYTEKSIAVFGETKSVKDQLKSLGGRFNGKLKRDGEICAGWVFSKNKLEVVKNFINSVAPELPENPEEINISVDSENSVSVDNANEVKHLEAVDVESPLTAL